MIFWVCAKCGTLNMFYDRKCRSCKMSQSDSDSKRRDQRLKEWEKRRKNK